MSYEERLQDIWNEAQSEIYADGLDMHETPVDDFVFWVDWFSRPGLQRPVRDWDMESALRVFKEWAQKPYQSEDLK